MYYGYINDMAFFNAKIITDRNIEHPQLIVDKIIEKYFNHELIVHDQREERLTYKGMELKGEISFHYDGNQHTKNDVLDSRNTEDIQNFFRVLEHVYMSNIKSEDDVNTLLLEDKDAASIYINGSLKYSKDNVDVKVIELSTIDNAYVISMPTYFEFDLLFPGQDVITIRAYIDRTAFLEGYPISTITNIVFPCDATYLLDPNKFDGNMDTLIKSTAYSLGDLSTSIPPDNHSGLVTYYTRYVTSSVYGSHIYTMVPFGVLYQGDQPSSLQIREHIKNDLIALGIAPESKWESLFPDVFVDSQFFIIPMWDNYTDKVEGRLYSSIINAKKYADVIPKLFANLPITFVQQYQEMLVYGQGELFLTSIPDPLNKEGFSIQEKHPTYQIHMAQDGVGYLNQAPETREFNQLLNMAMAVATGADVIGAILTQVIDGHEWHSFTSSKTEYHILSQASYTKFFNL